MRDYFPLGGTAEGNDKAAADTAVIKKKAQERGKRKHAGSEGEERRATRDSAGGRKAER